MRLQMALLPPLLRALLLASSATAADGRSSSSTPDPFALVPIFHPRPVDGMHSNDVNAPFFYRPPGAKAGAFHVMSDTGPLAGAHGCQMPHDPQAQLDSGCCKGWSHYASLDLVHWENVGCAVANTSWFDSIGLDTGSATMVSGRPALMYPGVHPNRTGELPNWNCVSTRRDCTANALIIATPTNYSDVWLRHWTKQPQPAISCHNGRCPMNESGYIDDPSTAWHDPATMRYYATFGSGSMDKAVGDGTQALLCSSPDYYSNWTCSDLLWVYGTNSSTPPRGSQPDGGAVFGDPGGNAIACPDFYQLPAPHDDLWVYEAGLEPKESSSAAALEACVGLAGCYWIGHYHPPPDPSSFEHRFEPIHPGPKAMMGGDSVGKSFWHEESQRRLLWSSHAIGGACAGKCDQVLSIAKVVSYDSEAQRLTMWPAEELSLLRVGAAAHCLPHTTLSGSGEAVLPGATGCRLDIEANFSVPASFAGQVGIRVLCGGEAAPNSSDTGCSAPDAFVNVSAAAGSAMVGLANQRMALELSAGAAAAREQVLQLRLVVDGASMEMFVNGGLASVSGAVRLSGPALQRALQRAGSGMVRLFAAGQSAGDVGVVAEAHALSNAGHSNTAAKTDDLDSDESVSIADVQPPPLATTPLTCDMKLRKNTHADVTLSQNVSAWDSYNLMSPFVAKIGTQWTMFFSGGALTHPEYLRYQIGVAHADTPAGPWTRANRGKPILPLGQADDLHRTPTLLRNAGNAVLRDRDGLFHMVYCGNAQPSLFHATSSDGISWSKDEERGVILAGYAPSILRVNGTLWMYHVHDPGGGKPWEIGLAKGTTWDNLKFVRSVLSASQVWENAGLVGKAEQRLFYPNVVYARDGWTMAYSAYANRSAIGIGGSGLAGATGLAHSSDGLSWSKCQNNPMLSPTDGSEWDAIYACSPTIATDYSADGSGEVYLFYAGRIESKPMHKYFAAGHAVASKTDDDDDVNSGVAGLAASSTVIFAPMNFNGRADWPGNFTNLMFDLHYQPFGFYGNGTQPVDYYNVTTSYASAFTTLKKGSNLLRCDVVFWNWIGPNSHNCGATAADNRGLCKDWRQRWQHVHTWLQPWIKNGTFVGVNFGDELIGSGLHLADLTAAVNFVRSSWPEAVLYYNEDFSVMVSGFTGLDEKIPTPPGGGEWKMPDELDLFSVDQYCGFNHCTPEGTPPHPCELNGPGSGPAYNFSYDPACATHLRGYYERLIYPRLGPRTKVLAVPGAFAPAKGAHSPSCPYSEGPACLNPLNASLDVYDTFWAKHAHELWNWAQDDPRLVGFAPWHFDDEPGAYPTQLVTGFRNMPQTLNTWATIGEQIVANANEKLTVSAGWHEVIGVKTDDLVASPAPMTERTSVLSRRQHVLAPTPWTVEVSSLGAVTITIGAARFEVSSQFSEPGPLWNNLSTAAPPTSTSHAWEVAVDRARASAGTWAVTASAETFTLRRTLHLVPPLPQLPQKLLINDTITSKVSSVIGMHIRHHAALASGGGGVHSAAVPGRINAGACGTEENAGHEGTTPYHPTNFGRPDAWFNTTSGAALGIVALDDAFRAHGQARNFAVEKMNQRTPGTCEVYSPPAMRLSDPMLAIGAHETHTVEWMLLPQGSNCSTYFCFVNKLRHDLGTDTIVVGQNAGTENQLGNSPSFQVRDGAHAGNQLGWNGTGYTTAAPTSTLGSGDPRCKMPDGTYCPIWTSDWTVPQLQRYFEYQGVSVIPTGNGWSTCKMPQQAHTLPRGCRRPQNGHEFLEDSPDLNAWLRVQLDAAKRASTPQRKVKSSMYFESFQSTGINDSITYADSRLTDYLGHQVCYDLNATRPADELPDWSEQPAFYGTLENSYGKVLVGYIEKVFAMGFDGIWHDDYAEFGGAGGGFTFDTHDGRTAFLHPRNLSIQYEAASLALLTLPLEMRLKDIVEQHNGFMTCNGPPLTRTVIQRRFGQHVAENSAQQVSQHVQLYTPVMLSRPPGQCEEPDPKYFRNASSKYGTGDIEFDPIRGCGAQCFNIMNHLDEGVLTELDGAPLVNSTAGSTIMTYLYPITPIELGPGFVIGTDKVITKVSGVFQNSSAGTATVFVYEDCLQVAETRSGGVAVAGVQIRRGEVTLELPHSGQAAVVLWG